MAGAAATAARRSAGSTCTSAGSSTPCCTCCTPASGTRCSTTWATCRRPSRSSACSTRATSRRPPTRTPAAFYVEATEVEERDGAFSFHGQPVTREFGKMGKSLKNAVAPDDICRDYGADTLRLYEMYMGRLEQSKPWNTRDIVGVFRFLQRVWRLFVEEESGRLRVVDRPADDATRRLLHQTIAAVSDDMQDMRFNTAIAKLIELTNHLTPVVAASGELPREVAEPFVLMLTPMAPALRRGAVGPAGPRAHLGLRAVADGRSRAARRGRGRDRGAGQRQATGHDHRRRLRSRTTAARWRRRPASTPTSPPTWRARRSGRWSWCPGGS